MKGEKGFTLIEVLIAVSCSALLAIGAGMTTMQIFASSRQNSDWNIALRQAQSVGQHISQDALMVNTIDIGDDPETEDVEFISLFWKDWENGDTYDTYYLWLNSEDSLNELLRREITHDTNGATLSDLTSLVATNIYEATITEQVNSWRLNVETRSGDRSVIREYEISRRLQE